MTAEWARLGALLKAARRQRGLQQQDIVQMIGVKRGAIRNIERGDISRLTPTIREYARLVGWTETSPDGVLSGEEPAMRDAPEANAAPTSPVSQAGGEVPDDLSMAVKHALREGPLVDSRTITVPTAGGRLTATIIVRGEPDASGEELHRALLELRDREWELRRRDESADVDK